MEMTLPDPSGQLRVPPTPEHVFQRELWRLAPEPGFVVVQKTATREKLPWTPLFVLGS